MCPLESPELGKKVVGHLECAYCGYEAFSWHKEADDRHKPEFLFMADYTSNPRVCEATGKIYRVAVFRCGACGERGWFHAFDKEAALELLHLMEVRSG